MQLQTLISNSGNFHYIDRFNDISKLAMSMKAQIYYADSITNKIYGFYEEGYSIIELDCPIPITSSILFSTLNTAYKNVVNSYNSFFYVDEYPFFIFPENRRADLMNSNIEFGYDYNQNIDDYGYLFRDKMTGRILDDCILTFDPAIWFRTNRYFELIKSYGLRSYTLSDPIIFEDIQNNEVINFVMANKVSQGAKLLVLNSGNRQYGLYVFKSLLGPVTKTDKLSLIIREDKFEKNKFMATFRVFKKKSKLGIPEVTSVTIDSHVFILNLF